MSRDGTERIGSVSGRTRRWFQEVRDDSLRCGDGGAVGCGNALGRPGKGSSGNWRALLRWCSATRSLTRSRPNSLPGSPANRRWPGPWRCSSSTRPSRPGVFLVAWILRATLRQLRFEAFDRHLGMVMGGIEAALLGMVGTLFVVSLAPERGTPIFASTSGKIVGQVMNSVGPVLPDEVRHVLAPFWTTSGQRRGGETSPSVKAPFCLTLPLDPAYYSPCDRIPNARHRQRQRQSAARTIRRSLRREARESDRRRRVAIEPDDRRDGGKRTDGR